MSAPPARLRSLDALRGFDMLWILGGAGVLRALAESPGGPALSWLAGQTHHVEWDGFRAWDGIFPLFLFLAGVSMPLSFEARRRRGASTAGLAGHALRRGVTLVLLGAVYNGLLAFDWGTLRWASVLGRIGLGWMLAAFILLRFGSTRALCLWTAGILLGYWALLTLVPVPGQGYASLEPGKTLVDLFDRMYLPGRLHHVVRDPEGLLSTIPAVATCLSGVLAGRWLGGVRPPTQKALRLAAAGAAAILLALLWDCVLPINKNLWSSSFVALTSGGGLVLLALFYWVIDVRGWQRWCLPLQVIGANAIAAYLLSAFVDFSALGELLLGSATPGSLHPAFLAGSGLLLEWLLLYALYRRRVFLRV
jgi:predicted acyltransferase